ncbi:cardio acceleratory peptide 2b [Daktulosphaira vitifoliae]|uniref:cardio acceleratory peptide 2b n=1 Tax=Daktulosphaira vitifoliae TaxID=58002 RepID=UPI0021AAFEFB|nr:cardio acceleratory peptide 2b [Daktulosphaira vitifoliae]
MMTIHVYISVLLLFFSLHCFTCAKRHDSIYGDELKRDNSRNRRESFAGLIAFPRVGRSQIIPDLQNVYNEQKEFSNHKREGLIPFPRIGRRNEMKNSALWFGPRLGRSIKDVINYDTYLNSDASNMMKNLMEIKNENYSEDEENLLL